MSQTFLNYRQKLEFLQSGFHQYFLIHLDTQDQIQGNMPTSVVNITLKLEDIGGGSGSSAWGINKRLNFINETYDNVLFTPESNFEAIYEYEYYKGVYYIKAKPFEETIVMHLLPKETRASDKILKLKDSDAAFTRVVKNYNASANKIYMCFKSIDVANNNQTENRPITAKPYPKFHKFGSGDVKKFYQKHNGNNWTKEDYQDSYAEYIFDISSWAKNLMNIQINAGYSYNNSSPINDTTNNPYAIHYTGIKDITNTQIEDRAVLMDANYDNVSSKTNNIQQMEFYQSGSTKQLRFPTQLQQDAFKEGFNNSHTNGSKFHKTIKYFNDILYTEENGQYVIGDWDDPSI